MQDIGFTELQREELRNIGVLREQIDELEREALLSMRAFLRQQPAMSDVRDVLANTFAALKAAEKGIVGLLSASRSYPSEPEKVLPADAALARVLMASFEVGADGDVLDCAMPPIKAAIHVVGRALSELPTRATRHKFASGYPVQRIDVALTNGFLEAHGQRAGADRRRAATPLPPYKIERSYAAGSDYLRVVEICYEAAGAGEGSRERPIRNFLKQKQRLRTERRLED